MASPFTLFEVSWEVCNKVGGIHTVVSTKAKTLVERLDAGYVCVGPWLLGNAQSERSFQEERGHEAFAESCRQLGVPVRVGRWRIPGSPRTILVEFSGLYAQKDAILAGLWEQFGVDSITGQWDYVEPVVFGHAAGIAIERWCQELAWPQRGKAVAQIHEWMTGSCLLYLKKRAPAIGTVFTTHATVLGRALASGGVRPEQGLLGRSPDAAAEAIGVRSKHSMEKTCALQADVFTTVSDVTSLEAELFFGRGAEPLLPNGIDLDVIDELAGGVDRARARAALQDLAQRFLGRDCSQAAFLLLSGRYEYSNKGIDLLLEAAARLNRRAGREVVLFLTVPAGQSGIGRALHQRLEDRQGAFQGAAGLATHNLIDPERDPIQQGAARLGLSNVAGSRVALIHVPIYLHRGDGLLDLPYEAVLRAVDLTCFPSFYEPWGYTPEESLAVGVPTVTTDLSGFGRWALAQSLTPADGIHVLRRDGLEPERSAEALADLIDTVISERTDAAAWAETCRRTAQRMAWSDLIEHYDAAFARALEAAEQHAAQAPPVPYRPQIVVPVAPKPEGRRPRLFPFDVAATLPAPLEGLERLSRNFYWTWDPEGPELYEELSPASWSASGWNPVQFLRVVFPEDLRRKAAEARYVEKLQRVLARFEAYLRARRAEVDLGGGVKLSARHPIAYFCAEFGVHASLRVYSGGLGILAGDHLKSASDLDLPLVAVGLFYRHGYLRQRVTAAGDQVALEALNDPRRLPLELARDEQGAPIEILLQLPSSTLTLRAWSAEVGRVRLYLLDADVESNRPEDRAITQRLYGGDHEHRLRQEIVLGRGGVRLLERLALRPAAWHINEGHAAFLTLERVGSLVRQGLTFEEARELVRATTAFTTHTPVPAGHDRFSEDLMRRYFSDAPDWMGLPWERFMALGASESQVDAFNMTYLALSFAGFVNGVSRLHGEVTKDLLHAFWPGLLRTELPVRSVTNGVHLSTWVRPELGRLLGAEARLVSPSDFEGSGARLDLDELWAARQGARRALLGGARASLERSAFERSESPLVLARMLEGLDERALLIGFARRFAPYKRAALIFKDAARLARILKSEDRPVRLFFAGKAHPRDAIGQEVLRGVVQLARSADFVGKVFFLEDYDMELARSLVQGVDVWLNTPIRRLEASGTSGMKAAANGALHLSVADGWWVEGYDASGGSPNGWSLGEGRALASQELEDEQDSASLCRLLEEEVVPLYFERGADGVPRKWLERVRRSLATLPHAFNTDRMVGDYLEQAYRPMAEQFFALSRDDHAPLRSLAAEHARVRRGFAEVKIVAARMSSLVELCVGDVIEARAEVDLGPLAPRDVVVELVLGHTQGAADLRTISVVRLHAAEAAEGPRDASPVSFEGSQALTRSGSFSYGLRVRACERGPLDLSLRDLVLWA